MEVKIKQAKFEYEQYFLGHRPREPVMPRGEVQKIIAYWSNLPIRNTAQRFRFNTLCSRFFTFRRRWDDICRQIENGTYEPHLKKLERVRMSEPPPEPSTSDDDVYAAYREAREACGQGLKGLDRKKMDALLAKQRDAITAKYGCDDVKFRVVVEGGKAKLKASPVAGPRTR